jgi:branched-chain amino acid transport system permease protein
VFALLSNEYVIHLAILVSIYLILAQSFNLTFGLGRFINLAHVASYAVGAYTTAILSVEYGYSFPIAIFGSVIVSGLFALLIGVISLRLSGDYFAIGTLSFSFIVSALLINWKSLTRGVLGIPGIPRPLFMKSAGSENTIFFFFSFSCAVLSLLVLWILFNSRIGRGLSMQSEHVHASQSLGVPLFRLRNLSFIISSAFAGLAGGIFAIYLTYIDPGSFSLHEMVFVLTIVIVGSPGSFWGVCAGTVFLVLLPEPLRFLEISPSVLGPVRQLLYASILFFVVYVRRERIFPVKRLV